MFPALGALNARVHLELCRGLVIRSKQQLGTTLWAKQLNLGRSQLAYPGKESPA